MQSPLLTCDQPLHSMPSSNNFATLLSQAPPAKQEEPAPSSIRLPWPEKRDWASVYLDKIADTVRSNCSVRRVYLARTASAVVRRSSHAASCANP